MTDSRRPLPAHFDAAPDDFDHPDYDHLVALVDDRLDAADREWVTSHVDACGTCQQDVDDLLQIKAALEVQPVPSASLSEPVSAGRRRKDRSIVVVAAAAGLLLALWFGTRPAAPDPSAPATSPLAQAPVPTSSPTRTPAASPLNEEELGRVNRALATGRLELPANMAVLRGHEGTLLGPGATASFIPSIPTATAVVEARPQFAWTASPGATRYTVTVFDERFRQVTKSGVLKTNTWTPSRDLPRGRVLQWQITATTRDGVSTISPIPPNPEARFIVLSPTAVAEIARERTRLATEPIALGLVLAKAGLFGEAERVLESAIGDERYNRQEVRALIARLRAR